MECLTSTMRSDVSGGCHSSSHTRINGILLRRSVLPMTQAHSLTRAIECSPWTASWPVLTASGHTTGSGKRAMGRSLRFVRLFPTLPLSSTALDSSTRIGTAVGTSGVAGSRPTSSRGMHRCYLTALTPARRLALTGSDRRRHSLTRQELCKKLLDNVQRLYGSVSSRHHTRYVHLYYWLNRLCMLSLSLRVSVCVRVCV